MFTFLKIGYSALNLVHAKFAASSLEPGSCLRNWLHGNAKTSKPKVIHQKIFEPKKLNNKYLMLESCNKKNPKLFCFSFHFPSNNHHNSQETLILLILIAKSYYITKRIICELQH